MLSKQTYRADQAHKFSTDVHPLVSELFQLNRAPAEMQIWRDLKDKAGAVWHRQSNPELRAVSHHLMGISHQLKETKGGYSRVSSASDVNEAIQQTLRQSQLVTERLLSSEQIQHLESELRLMHGMIFRMTGEPTAVIDLRIERSHAFIENFHQDYGTSILMALLGPGPHFIKPDNKPAEHQNAFFRAELPRPDEVFEVPTCSLLAMRGKSDSDHARERSPSGLWHSSPSKVWNDKEQWDTRVLLIVTSPQSEILPAPPIMTS